MSRMGLLGAISFSLALVSLSQIPHIADGCQILSAKSSGPSAILVKWDDHVGATNYFLDLRVKNNKDIAPIVVTLPATWTETTVNGLRPGTEYSVILKVFQFYFLVCVDKDETITVPDTSQIVEGKSLSSTSIMVQWTEVLSADHYNLRVHSQATGDTLSLNYTDVTTTVVENLQPATNYDCYVYSANRGGQGRGSKVRTITTLIEPPVGVAVTETSRGTVRVTWQPVEDVLLYQVSIQDTDEPTSTVYNVSDTKLDVHGILPCSTYRISVSSFNMFLFPSEPTVYTYTTNKLTPVSSVSVDYTCTTHSATVHWTAVFGAESYEATAKADNGTELMCTSQGTSCQISGLKCGQSYVVHVTPASESCTNMMNSTSATFQTVPCPPTNLELFRECSNEVIIFSWDRTNNTDHYMAKAVDSQGEIQECLTVDNSCYFTHTVCGSHYYFSVYSIAGHCKSQISSNVDIRTAPCIPQNMQTSADCGSDVLLSKWDLAEGALNYTVEAYGNKGEGNYHTCSSMSNSCAMEGVHCGDVFTIYITAYDNECASPRTLGPAAETVPCAPQNVTAIKDCGTYSITVFWIGRGSAIFYIATAIDSNGDTHSCISMDKSCKIEGLKCNTEYRVYVIASNFLCNSTESEMVIIETAACPPDHVTGFLDCAANMAVISWQGQPEINSYTATMVDEDQVLLSCSTIKNSCMVPNLKCGQRYTVSVSHHDGICPSMPSEPIYMDSVPCGPSVTADLDCQSQVLTLNWSATSNAEGYITVFSNSNKQISFNTTEPALTVNTLECGLDYTLKVMSFNGTCVSHASELLVWQTPCVPTNVTMRKDCNQRFAHVTWQTSRGALSYQATANDKDGQSLQCSSSETLCRLDGLMCSQVYNVSVTALNDKCTSNESSVEILHTEPCPPSNLNATVNCANDSAMLSWSSSPNAVSYTGKAVSTEGHSVTCDAGMNLGCQLIGLDCGTKYTFTVSASDGDCQSPDSEPVTHSTAPCAVESVIKTLDCTTNILTVSWSSGSVPMNYSAIALSVNETALRCMTEGSSCALTNLQCGQQYTVTVRAISNTCEGHSSIPEVVNSVPCIPVNVQGMVECSTNTLETSWDAAAGAETYISTLQGAGGFPLSCHSALQRCFFPGLQCAQTYMYSVVAQNDRCNSSESAMISVKTAPCDPTNVIAALECNSGVVTVNWGPSTGADYYTVVAEANGHVDSCVHSSSSCKLTQLQCGEVYTVTVLAGDGSCNSSILAKTNITTAPCPPVIQDHSLDCVSNHALVTWFEDEDAMSVTVSATSNLGHSAYCVSSTNNSCVLDELQCGQSYTVHAVAQGMQCLSEPSSSFQIVTAPCTPSHVGYTYSCDTGIAFLSWDETLGREHFYANIYSEDDVASCITSQTDCVLPSLLCGHLYNVTVIAVAAHCNSSVPGVTQIQTAPCAPMNVSASLVCNNNTAVVSWQHTTGAVYYKVTANSRNGDVKECTANVTSCHIPNMHCAETYVITVTPYTNRCKGFDSQPHFYITGPCPPTNVDVSLQCVGNIGHVTWTAAPQADYYVATAITSDVDEQDHQCTSNQTSCSLTDIHCGETSVVTVVTFERGCMSEPSLPFTFQSVICPPTTVAGVTTCINNDITVSWDPSPESGTSYIVQVQEEGGSSAQYPTAQTSHLLTGLQCGELFNLTVAASDAECTSVFSEPVQTETAPCPPTNLTARTDCGTSMGTLSWAPSIHAISYTARVTGIHGHVVSCSSNTTTCTVKLDCGREYTAVVIASSATCNSSTGAVLTFDSAPCLPDGVVAELDCYANFFSVQWSWKRTYLSTYTAIAIGSDNSRSTCDSLTTNCIIENINCGVSYSIVVTVSSVDCGTIEGSDYSIQSAPCTPDTVQVDLQCSSNNALVTWQNSGPDQTQVVSAVDSSGMTTTCNSSSSNCTFEQLTCGENYLISVVGHTDKCSSQPAVAETLSTAPCKPTHLTALVDCHTGITVVTWDSARGATSYTVYAQGSLGYNAECNSIDTNCDFPNLACGQDYTITVVARHDSCVSLVSESFNITTGPCPHSALRASLDCETNTAVVSWTPGSGILYYNATAEAFDITHLQTCSTIGSSCNISSLLCGESYRVTVSGQGQNCPSPAQDWHRITTAPCPPVRLRVDSSCESNNISVSWQASQGSLSYMAIAENAEGRSWSCNTSSTNCQISGLPCGQQYSVYVAGVNYNCIGAKSNIKMIYTAPCVPHNVQNNLDCLSGILNVTWQSTGHVVHFYTTVESSEGHISSCETDQHLCVVSNMHCGLTYSVTVVAKDEVCNSSQSPTQEVITAPCPLTSFLPVINCTTGVVSVTWSNSAPGVEYMVSAVDTTDNQHNCSSSNRGCDLTTFECGTEYSITITPSRNGCVGRDSPTQMIKTVPCIPQLSEVEIDCLTNSAWVMYEESAGAESYLIMATDSLGNIQTFECNASSDAMCSLPPLICSQNLTFTIEAVDQQCSSAPSNAFITETAPCPPEDIVSSVSCDNRTASISWSAIPGAVTYTATLEQMNGGTTCCTTSVTSCDISDLMCGEIYILLVMAEGRTCNSSQSEGEIIRTAPCIPQNLQANLSCSDNVASMSWNLSIGLGQLYRVTAVSADGHVDECSSHEQQCDLTGLLCGQNYTATVMAEHMNCSSKPSDSVMIKTVPCTPANISSDINCETNALIVSWTESSGADSYIATALDSYGQTTTCQGTTKGSCSVAGVACGQIYHVSVVSSDGYCNSPSSPMVDAPAVPCQASHISAVMDCYTKTALVAWYASDGALTYEVMATTTDGHSVTCEASVTHCDLEGLLCGQSYHISVKAVGQSCSSIAHMTEQLVTEPCIPEHINTLYSLSIGQVLWDITAGAGYYTLEGVTEEGLTVSCITNDTYCALYNMVCGQTYLINITANNHVCQGMSISTEIAMIKTEPCPPDNVEANVQCHTSIGTVSWESSSGALGYEVRLAGRDGHSLSCYNVNTFCHVEDLHCGVIYYTNVIAIGETLNSSLSATALLAAAPCTVENVAVNMDCYKSTAGISWTSTSTTVSYMVTAVAEYGQMASCETNDYQCELTGLQCGETYNVSITTNNDHCQTETLTNVTFSTRPCKPLRVGVDLSCGSSASLYWEDSEGVELYMATANNSKGMIQQCNSTNSPCEFSNLLCGETYEFSVTAYSHMCFSEVSSTVESQTEPCQPTGLTISGSCDNETVELDWSAADGASVYEVTATGDLGYVTSFQTNETSIAAELPCGQLFNFTVKARGDRCDATVSLSEQFKTGPCVPEHVQSFTHCENNLGSVSWAKSDGAESYMAIAVAQDGHTHMCTTNSTTCTWNDLHCGEIYDIHIIANDYLCNSMPSNSSSIRMAPCIPQNVESSLNCTIKAGSLTWDASETADYYIVTAETTSGHRVELSTNDTWTFISEFQCGQEYFLSVQAVDSECTSHASPPSKLNSAPCPPTDVSSLMNCLSNIAVVSWTSSAGAEFYTARVTQDDGQSTSCLSDSEQCGIPNVICGQNYTVTVVASNDKCDSDPSEADTLQSVPCVPADVAVSIECSNNQAVVSWSASEGAVSYKAMAQSTQGAVALCESTNQSCALTNLTCGQTYYVQVIAQDDICSSLPSSATEFHSVPCTPNNGSVVLDCFTNSGLLTWDYAEGALIYIATAQSISGHVSTCTTNYTNCELKDLQCGQIYNVSIEASNNCHSSPSTMLQVESVPCPPEDIEHYLDCSTNTAHIEWQTSTGADSYIVQAMGLEEHETGCMTDSNSCEIDDLLCGFTYNISVIAVNSACNVSQSGITQLKAVPCVPQHVEARVVCHNGAVAVSWESSKGASSYMTVAQGNAGYTSTCNSNQTTCLFDDLLCGLNYSITVSASDDMCSSAESSAVELNTVPCVPQKVTAEMVCGDDTGVVSWEDEEGVSSYMVRAFGPDGHKTNCNSTTTSCQLPNMHCGQLYNLTVTAQDGQCDNSHAYHNLQSVPCRPTNVMASLQCHSNAAAVTWERASGALFYRAVGVTEDGSHETECNNTVTHCDLSDLQCGQTYNVSVFGLDESCSSVESDTAYMRTAPCPPQDVAVDSECDDGAIVVSWSPNPDAQYCHVVALSNTLGRHYCNSSGAACTISELPCGQKYNVTVMSVRDGCESEPSTMVETSSAPCSPRNANGRLDCVSNSAWVMWNDSEGAQSYLVMAQEVGGHNSSCISTSSPCNVPDLKCGAVYTFNVTAVNKDCRSNHRVTFELETGPCALTEINAVTQCNSGTILVEWELTVDKPLYVVTAEGQDQSIISCNSAFDSCELQDVRCDMHYNIIVSASSDKCSSLRSPPKKIKTAPCVPSNVSVVPLCEVTGVAVAWGHSPVATSYSLTATGQDGHIVLCNTLVNNCNLTHLHCGQLYEFNITASGENCTSQPVISSFRTVPCEPSGLEVDCNCETNSAILSWDNNDGVVKYFGHAQSMDGDRRYCQTSSTSCIIEGLKCGSIYNFSVEASDGECNSFPSDPLQAGAAPCAPAALNVRMQKIGQNHWAMVSWDSVNCSDVEYLVVVTGRIQNHPQAVIEISSYWLQVTYFELPMPCSTAYNLTVRSRNSAGVSEPSGAFTGVTVPCAPQNVRYTENTASAVLSWDASMFATRYTVYNGTGVDRVMLCETISLSCELTDFHPNTTEVTASNEEGESVPNQDITGPGAGRRRRDLWNARQLSHLKKDLEKPEVLTVEVNGLT